MLSDLPPGCEQSGTWASEMAKVAEESRPVEISSMKKTCTGLFGRGHKTMDINLQSINNCTLCAAS